MLVYKYRDGNINRLEGQDISNFERDLKSIERNFFWGTHYKDLNDPCEGIISIKRFKKQSKSLRWFLGKKRIEKFSKVQDALENLMLQLEKVGIYSLSRTFNDRILWAHYGNSHKGFCIEYNLEQLSKDYRHNFPLVYNDNIPEIGIEDIAINIDEIIKKLFGYKYKKWKFEEEHRIITNDNGINHYSYEAVKSIYFGLKMDSSQKIEIMNRLNGRGIKYFQIEHLPKTYKFTAKPINDINNTEITYLRQIPSEITGNLPINFKITKQNYWALRGKGNVEVELEKTLNEEELLWLAKLIKENLFINAELVIMIHYIKNKDRGIAWATSHFQNGKINVNINGYLEDE